jgi:putative chitinase
MKLHDLFYDTLDEALTRRAALLGLGAGALSGKAAAAQQDQPRKVDKDRENFILSNATNAGLSGNELAAFLSQLAHESNGFHDLEEKGSSRYFQKYDIKHNRDKAALLGNTQPGDGERYKGRGFLQLAGRENYRRAGEALNLPLLQHPELAAKPAVALQIALWFWQTRVRPHVRNWNDVRSVTHKINSGLKGLESRASNYHYYKNLLSSDSEVAQSR